MKWYSVADIFRELESEGFTEIEAGPVGIAMFESRGGDAAVASPMVSGALPEILVRKLLRPTSLDVDDFLDTVSSRAESESLAIDETAVRSSEGQIEGDFKKMINNVVYPVEYQGNWYYLWSSDGDRIRLYESV